MTASSERRGVARSAFPERVVLHVRVRVADIGFARRILVLSADPYLLVARTCSHPVDEHPELVHLALPAFVRIEEVGLSSAAAAVTWLDQVGLLVEIMDGWLATLTTHSSGVVRHVWASSAPDAATHLAAD